MEINVGDIAPDFILTNSVGEQKSIRDYKDKWLVLYFYPRDNTPGCTKEAIEFTEMYDVFKENGAEIIGVSKDSEKSHTNFINKHNLKIDLLSDPNKEMLQGYCAWGLKKMYGKESWGTVRTTYLISPDQKIAYIWNKVKVKGHVQAVLDKLLEIK